MIQTQFPTDVVYDASAKPNFALLEQMYVERGDRSDWEALHHLHYKTEGKPVGAHYYRLGLDGYTIGVVAMTVPRPLLKERHVAFPRFKPGADTKAANTARYQLINANIRVIGRIVLDTMYRGVGASYRFQNIVSRMSGYKIIEIQSAMSKYNLFAQRAGFKFVKPMRSNKYDQGLKFFRETFEAHPADTTGLLDELKALPEGVRATRIAAVRKFYYANSALEKTGKARDTGAARVQNLSVEELIRQLQQLILASPLYGVYLNPDVGRKDLPERIYLPQFDRQATHERMNLSCM